MEDVAPTIPDAFRRIVAFLEAERVPFVVIGGLAAGLQGEPRATRDVDLMVTLPTSRLHGILEAARAEGFHMDPEEAELHWLASGFVRLWYGPSGKQVAVDLMACNSDFLREASWRAQQTRFCGLQVPVATAEDVVLFKLAGWREKDIPDARAIVSRHGERLDTAYLRQWATWFTARNRCFAEMPQRLEALLEGGPLPPPVGQ